VAPEDEESTPRPRNVATDNPDYAIAQYKPPAQRYALGAATPDAGAQLLNGLASFVAERAQEELLQWFLDGVLDDLCSAGSKGETTASALTTAHVKGHQRHHPKLATAIPVLFPATCTLATASAQSSMPSRSALVAAVRADVNDLPIHLLVWADVPNGDIWGGILTELLANIRKAQTARTGADLMRWVAGIGDNAKLKTQCNGFAVDPATNKLSQPLPCYLMAIGMVAQAYIDANDSAKPMELTALATALKGTALTSDDVTKLHDMFDLAATRLFPLFRQFQATLTANSDATIGQRIALALRMANIVADLIVDAGTILLPDRAATIPDYVPPLLRAAAAISSNSYADAVAPIADALSKMEAKNIEIPRIIKQYTPLAIDLASAQSDKDVQSALAAAAQPAGGWRLKRAKFMFSFGALAGLYPNYQIGYVGGSPTTKAPAISAFAPIGFDFSWPILDNSTFGFFVSGLDLGNLVSARLSSSGDDANVKSTSTKITVTQVTALGFYPRFGLGRTPLVLALGGSWSPNLQEVTLTTNGTETTQNANVFRVGIALSADITILPF
jgi:hypothetical protein